MVGQTWPSFAGFSSRWAAPSVLDSAAAGIVLPFRERAPWLGGDLQTLRNVLCGGPLELPGGERLLLPMSDGGRLAARWLDRRPGPATRPVVVLVHGLTGCEKSGCVVASLRKRRHVRRCGSLR